ncbi:MaoC/PaaZ C-terminal domain-containing protein [Sulfobacillus thermosulfidooxidans]|uniref:MaoC/PaaZ C-terminal domain-containing protein n=1 Tax=Sulfobacillus thermosulfidooxidans TaxID=28034 RepID=UPI0003133841|nr:MaoC/PaaZ C-terminal domain-containing protein [Sulfobacillus thermosulfidooxidans]
MGWYYEDFQEGQQLTTPRRTVTESDVMQFAQLTGDFNPLHTDFEYAKEGRFHRPIAHGLLGLSLVLGLASRLNIFDETAVALLGIEQWNFLAPIYFGDTVHGVITIKKMRTTRDGLYGILYRHVQLLNQNATVVQEGDINIMMQRKPDSERMGGK